MRWEPPQETFPSIGTIENPAIFIDGSYHVLLCYEIAPVDGGGNVILFFDECFYIEQNSNNVPLGVGKSKYPVRAWEFTEVFDSERTPPSEYLKKRFWTISFNDVIVEIVFGKVQQVFVFKGEASPHITLLDYLRMRHWPGFLARG